MENPPMEMATWDIRCGHVLDELRAMPAESVHCVVTSPPYWGLRDYQLEPQMWGGDATCDHQWEEHSYRRRISDSKVGKFQKTIKGSYGRDNPVDYETCAECGGWKGSLGLERSGELYLEHMRMVFGEIHRVLRRDGTLWLNMGDSYMSSYSPREDAGGGAYGRYGFNLKRKDISGMPWRVALALQGDGWYLRSPIVWVKTNAKTESVKDRPPSIYEFIFLMTKSERNYYDTYAIRRKLLPESLARYGRGSSLDGTGDGGPYGMKNRPGGNVPTIIGASFPNVWVFPTYPNPNAKHFATFPPRLPETCIMLGSPEEGVCGKCKDPFERKVARVPSTMNIRVRDAAKGILEHKTGHEGEHKASQKKIDEFWERRRNETETKSNYSEKSDAGRLVKLRQAARAEGGEYVNVVKTLGWEPSCQCGGSRVPATVLDPFNGTATTGLVALRQNRSYIGIELSDEYVRMSERRLIADNPLLNSFAKNGGR